MDEARANIARRYEPLNDSYNSSGLIDAALPTLLDPRNFYYAVTNEQGDIAAYQCFVENHYSRRKFFRWRRPNVIFTVLIIISDVPRIIPNVLIIITEVSFIITDVFFIITDVSFVITNVFLSLLMFFSSLLVFFLSLLKFFLSLLKFFSSLLMFFSSLLMF